MLRDSLRVRSKQQNDAPDSNHGKRKIGSHIAKVRYTEKAAAIRELVIEQGLRNPWDRAGSYYNRRG